MDALLVTCLLSACIVALGAAMLIGHPLTARILTIAATITAGAVLLFTLLA
ncbi:hypothetical protein ACIOD2_32330 [Amycolatopsis sp. NPDC088138]|uniref:hypothetical protein n=1 Tax=Amycolatopsis sp. NPDC088138 TaxID=3363938 RepID=UPI003813540E